jgi:hypothetical protein
LAKGVLRQHELFSEQVLLAANLGEEIKEKIAA